MRIKKLAEPVFGPFGTYATKYNLCVPTHKLNIQFQAIIVVAHEFL